MGLLDNIFDKVDKVLNDVASSFKTGYDEGNVRAKRMSDEELKRELVSVHNLGETRAYLDEGRRRGIVKHK
jgi:hypothetical protein